MLFLVNLILFNNECEKGSKLKYCGHRMNAGNINSMECQTSQTLKEQNEGTNN
jgi:hypothetical protein